MTYHKINKHSFIAVLQYAEGQHTLHSLQGRIRQNYNNYV